MNQVTYKCQYSFGSKRTYSLGAPGSAKDWRVGLAGLAYFPPAMYSLRFRPSARYRSISARG